MGGDIYDNMFRKSFYQEVRFELKREKIDLSRQNSKCYFFEVRKSRKRKKVSAFRGQLWYMLRTWNCVQEVDYSYYEVMVCLR